MTDALTQHMLFSQNYEKRENCFVPISMIKAKLNTKTRDFAIYLKRIIGEEVETGKVKNQICLLNYGVIGMTSHASDIMTNTDYDNLESVSQVNAKSFQPPLISMPGNRAIVVNSPRKTFPIKSTELIDIPENDTKTREVLLIQQNMKLTEQNMKLTDEVAVLRQTETNSLKTVCDLENELKFYNFEHNKQIEDIRRHEEQKEINDKQRDIILILSTENARISKLYENKSDTLRQYMTENDMLKQQTIREKTTARLVGSNKPVVWHLVEHPKIYYTETDNGRKKYFQDI